MLESDGFISLALASNFDSHKFIHGLTLFRNMKDKVKLRPFSPRNSKRASRSVEREKTRDGGSHSAATIYALSSIRILFNPPPRVQRV